MTDQSSKKSNKDLLDELGIESELAKKPARSPREERIIAGFEEIQRFVEQNGRSPAHGEDKDIFERLYATRLEQINSNEEYRNLVQELDYQKLLNNAVGVAEPSPEYGSDKELLAELGVGAPKEGDVTFLEHVKPRAEIRAAEEVANRIKCENFDVFKPIFDNVKQELDAGVRKTIKFRKGAGFAKIDIQKGRFFFCWAGRPLMWQKWVNR